MNSAFSQIAAIALGGLLGWRLLSTQRLAAAKHCDYGVSRRKGALLLALFAVLLGLSALASLSDSTLIAALASFYQTGSLVFGGGHVVLPLLQADVIPPGWVGNDTFLAGYAVAQAVPGPLFSFAAFLGTTMSPPLGGWSGGIILLLAIYLPSFLLVAGALPYWESLRQRDDIQHAMGGVNAAVVGVLGAALYDPVWTSAIQSIADFCWALAALGALMVGRFPPAVVVALAAIAGLLFGA
jgi:chromate transporter